MPPKSNVPIRIGGSKTRSGCRTCKNRHVKCDERHPVCSRCERADRQCLYNPPPVSKPRQGLAADEAGPIALSTASRHRRHLELAQPSGGISPYGPHGTIEISAIKSFATYLGKELAGCFSDHVWCEVFPRMAQHESSIWHAIVATSMLDTNIRLGTEPGDENANIGKAVVHYNKAIRELNLRLSPMENAHSKDVILVSCLLFAIFECLRRHFTSALRHVSSGVKLLIGWTKETPPSGQDSIPTYLNYASLRPIFLSLDSQAIQLGAADFRDDFSHPAISSQLQAPQFFTTTEEPHLLLNQIFNRFSHWAQWIGPGALIQNRPSDDWMLTERHEIQSQFEAWDRAFDASWGVLQLQPAVLLLLTQRKVLQAHFNKQIEGDSEMVWDNSLPLFEEAVQYAESYTNLTARHSGRSNNLTVAMDIVMSLFLISIKCRHTGIRRRALTMLQNCDRREGIWDSYMCARIAESIVMLEERGSLEDGHVPESERIFELDVSLGEETNGVITHKKLVPLENGTYAIETATALAW